MQKLDTKSAYRRFYYVKDTINTDQTKVKNIWKSPHQPATKMSSKLYNSEIDVSIEHLNLSPRTYSCLNRAGIKTSGAILALPPNGLFKVRNLGRKGIEEIITKLNSLGIKIEKHTTLNYCVPSRLNERQLDEGKDVLKSELEIDDFEPLNEQSQNSISVKELGLHPMVYNCLISAGYKTLEDLVALIEQKGIRGLNNINRLSADKRTEVIDSLHKQGINF